MSFLRCPKEFELVISIFLILALSHRNACIGLSKRGGIIDTIAHKGNGQIEALQALDFFTVQKTC